MDWIRDKILNAVGLLVAIPAVVIGMVAGKYLWLHAFIPLAGALLCGWVANRTAKSVSKPMVLAFAVQGGLLVWAVVGFILMGRFNFAILDIVVLLAGLIWLMAQPGLRSVIFLTIYQTIGLFANSIGFLTAEVGSNDHKALLVYLIFRGLAITLMFAGLRSIRGRESKPLLQDKEKENVDHVSMLDKGKLASPLAELVFEIYGSNPFGHFAGLDLRKLNDEDKKRLLLELLMLIMFNIDLAFKISTAPTMTDNDRRDILDNFHGCLDYLLREKLGSFLPRKDFYSLLGKRYLLYGPLLMQVMNDWASAPPGTTPHALIKFGQVLAGTMLDREIDEYDGKTGIPFLKAHEQISLKATRGVQAILANSGIGANA